MSSALSFRHEYARLVALLCKRYGMHRFDAIEDAVQSAMEKALQRWPQEGEPQSPEAWLYRVANNALIDELRRENKHEPLDVGEQQVGAQQASSLPSEIGDESLRMLFICCDPSLVTESQLVFALKVLCGFSVREIALRLLISDANAYKRYSRAREKLTQLDRALDLPPEHYQSRLKTVRAVIYLLFTEGYLSSHQDLPLRRDFCDEALRLANLLHQHPVGQNPETEALLALMYLHRSRMTARSDESGGLILLADQDRSLWQQDDIQRGLYYLQASARGEELTRYHVEAGIAAEHCLSPSFQSTNWQRIVEQYDLLETIMDSPMHALNKAIALAEWKGPQAAINFLENCVMPSWLHQSYLWFAVKAELFYRINNTEEFSQFQQRAIELAPNGAIITALRKRWEC